MTLLVNEIHVGANLHDSFIIFAADRRITPPDKAHPQFMKKVIKVPRLKAGIGYYGLAEMSPKVFLAGWLPNFVNNASETQFVHELATKLHGELGRRVSKEWLMKQPSGFHVCGYNASGFPELWHICNHDMEGNTYKHFSSHYGLSEDFLRRDAAAQGFNGTSPSIRIPFEQHYINGDVRPYHSVWNRLSEALTEMFSYRDFKRPLGPDEYVEVVKWKMKVIASFYERFAKQPIIGGAIDAFAIVP